VDIFGAPRNDDPTDLARSMTLSHRIALQAAVAAGALMVFTPGCSTAQGQPQKQPVVVPPVEVVATRIPEAPHDVAASVEVISGADLRARGATSLRDALALAAGVAVAPGGDAGPASAVPEFWGLREFDAFLLVVDEVPWGGALNPAIATASLRDVERIEILRGPAPVTYGATSFVGVIHVVHNAAATRARYAEAHGGNFGTGGVAADIALPVWSSWQSRLSGDFDRQGFNDKHTSYSRGHALWRTARVGENRRTWLNADVNVLRQDPASPHPREGASLSSAVPLDANHNPAGAYLNENRLALSGGWERLIGRGARWGTTASYTFSGQSILRGFLTDISNNPDNASGFKENIDVNDLYVDSHLIWPTKANIRLMTGADLLFAAGEAEGATFTYTAPLDASTQAAVAEPTILDKDAEDERRFLGAYSSAEWRPTSRINFNGGLRLNATAEKRGPGTEVSHTRLSGALGVIVGVWERGPDHVRAFANFRNTFKPAAFDFSLAENEGILEPETSRSYEVGFKAEALDALVDFEASAFRMDFENLVTPTIVGGLPALINAGKTRFKGVELASDVRLPFSSYARATYSIHDGKFVDFVQEFGGVPTQLGGNRFEMSARQLASAGLVVAPEHGLIANAVLNYSGDRYLNRRNTALAPAFSTVDAGVGYRLDNAELRLDAHNLTDRRDAVSESEFGDAQYYRMPARTFRTGVVVRY
jgi:iron complex outermembrane receptor protein